jgi:pyridoxine 4-dehydrogenase
MYRPKKALTFLKQAQADGKIKHIGLSEVDIDDIKKAQDYFEVVSVQNMYSVDNRKWEGVLNYCEDNNIAFIPWFPLNAGNVAAQEKLQQVAEKHGATVHQVALSWLLNHSKNILLIPGTSSVAHLEENMKTANVVLDAEDIDELDGISPPVG